MSFYPPPPRSIRVASRVVDPTATPAGSGPNSAPPAAPPAPPPASPSSLASLSQPPLVRRLDLLIEILLGALLAFLPAAFGAVDPWSEMVAMALGGGIAVLLAARAVASRVRWRWPLDVWLPIAAFVALAALQLAPLPAGLVAAVSPGTAEVKRSLLEDLPDAPAALARMTLSFYPLATRHDLRLVLLAATAFAAVVTVCHDPRRLRRLLVVITVIAAAFAALALAQDATGTTEIYWTFDSGQPARNGTFGNHSHYAQHMNLSVGCALALLLAHLASPAAAAAATAHRAAAGHAGAARPRAPSPLRRHAVTAATALVIVVGLATLSLSLSRGGILAMLTAGAFTLVVLLSVRSLRWTGGVVAGLALAALACVAYFGFDVVYDRMVLRGALGGRAHMIRDTLAMVRQFPLAGTGLGTFEWVYPGYDTTGVYSTATHLENEYVQVLAETGVVGLAAVIAFLAAVWRRWLRAVRSADPAAALAAVGLSYGLLAVMIQSLADFGQHVPANAVLSAVVCGLLVTLGGPRGEGRAIGATGRAMRAIAAVAACGLAAWTVVDAERARRADHEWTAAQRIVARLDRDGWPASEGGRFDRLRVRASAAVAHAPQSAYYGYWSAVYRWRIARNLYERGDPMLLAAARDAVAELNRARALCPTFGPIYSVLGQIEQSYLDSPEGAAHLEAAWRLEPNDPLICFVAGKSDARRAKWSAAAVKFRRATDLDQEYQPRVVEFYVNEARRPEEAMAWAEGSWSRLIFLGKTLWDDPRHATLARQAMKRGCDLLEQQARTAGINPFEQGLLAGHRFQLGEFDAAARDYAVAAQREPTNIYLRLAQIDALEAGGRIDEALAEARATLRLNPTSSDAKWRVEKLTRAQK